MATYNELLKAGWTMSDVDGMDMPGFLSVRAWDAKREERARIPKRRFIDEAWPQRPR